MIGLECVYRYTQTDNFCFSLCRLCIRKLETRSISWSRKPIGRRTRTQRTNSIKTRHSPRDTEQLFPYSPYWMILKVERRVLSPPPTLLLSKTWWGEDPLLFKKSFLYEKKRRRNLSTFIISCLGVNLDIWNQLHHFFYDDENKKRKNEKMPKTKTKNGSWKKRRKKNKTRMKSCDDDGATENSRKTMQ